MITPWQSHPALVSYDVFDDHRRDRLREVLRFHGDWLQRSLWLLPVTSRHTFTSLTDCIDHLVAPVDRVISHRPCPTCLARILTPRLLASVATNRGSGP